MDLDTLIFLNIILIVFLIFILASASQTKFSGHTCRAPVVPAKKLIAKIELLFYSTSLGNIVFSSLVTERRSSERYMDKYSLLSSQAGRATEYNTALEISRGLLFGSTNLPAPYWCHKVSALLLFDLTITRRI